MEFAEGLGRFGRLLQATKLACDELAPLVRELYKSADKLNHLKSDKSPFTIADGLVQEMLAEMYRDPGLKFKAIVGEEDVSSTNLHTQPYSVSGLQVPEELADPIQRVREALGRFGRELSAMGNLTTYQDTTIFIDPIDGTYEFISGMGEQCTILVGFAVGGHPVAGIVYRPVPSSSTWAMGCKEESLFDFRLDEGSSVATTSSPPRPHGMLTSNGPISPFLEEVLARLASEQDAPVGEVRVRAGGVGNKVLNLLENKGQFYVQDRGVKRWDTCAPQAVLEAQGGLLVKASRLLAAGTLESYKYAKSATNLDLNADFAVALNEENQSETEGAAGFLCCLQPKTRAIKPYANLCGFVALGATSAASSQLGDFKDLLREAAVKSPPAFS